MHCSKLRLHFGLLQRTEYMHGHWRQRRVQLERDDLDPPGNAIRRGLLQHFLPQNQLLHGRRKFRRRELEWSELVQRVAGRLGSPPGRLLFVIEALHCGWARPKLRGYQECANRGPVERRELDDPGHAVPKVLLHHHHDSSEMSRRGAVYGGWLCAAWSRRPSRDQD